MPRKETYSGPLSAQAQQDLVSEGLENYELPKSVVMKIAKSSLPDNVKLQKETVLSLVKGSTVFINYLAATAHDVAQNKQHKSISASDVLKALEMIEFGDMVNKLQDELLVYREVSKNDKGKKGPSYGVPSWARKGQQPSVSAPLKNKGKEKAGPLPPPFTSAPLIEPGLLRFTQREIFMNVDEKGGSISALGKSAEDRDDDEVMSVVSDGEPADANAIADQSGMDEEEQEEPLVDTVALEEEQELKMDGRALEEWDEVDFHEW